MRIPPFLNAPFCIILDAWKLIKMWLLFSKMPLFQNAPFFQKGALWILVYDFYVLRRARKMPLFVENVPFSQKCPFCWFGFNNAPFLFKMWLFSGKCPFLEISLCYDLGNKIILGNPKMWLFPLKCPFLKKWGFSSKKPLLRSQKCGFLFKNVAFWHPLQNQHNAPFFQNAPFHFHCFPSKIPQGEKAPFSQKCTFFRPWGILGKVKIHQAGI